MTPRTPVPAEFRTGLPAAPAPTEPIQIQPTGGLIRARSESKRGGKWDEPISEPQDTLIRKLLNEKQLEDRVRAGIESDIGRDPAKITKGRASEIIDGMFKLPYGPTVKGEAAQAPVVPEGRYALPEPTDTLNPIRFYTVKYGEGSWEGYTFVDRHSSDERYPVKGKERYRVLEAIAADPEAASKLYGHETNHCGVCGRELTRDDSRAKGIGPKCASKMEWAF